jgi:hypothetical protein
MDKLNKLFQEWQEKNPSGDLFQAFQGGLTAGAVSMRDRAQKIVQHTVEMKGYPNVNEVINAIGSLPDIPE